MKKVKEWKKLLGEEYAGYDEDMFWNESDDESMEAFSVLDEVVRYNGGVADAYEISELVNLLFNINLEDMDNEEV